MIFFKLSKNNKVIFSNLGSEVKEGVSNLNIRKVTRVLEGYEIELFGTDYDYKILANKHIADKTAQAYIMIDQVKEELTNKYNQEYIILSHNLLTSYSLLRD